MDNVPLMYGAPLKTTFDSGTYPKLWKQRGGDISPPRLGPYKNAKLALQDSRIYICNTILPCTTPGIDSNIPGGGGGGAHLTICGMVSIY